MSHYSKLANLGGSHENPQICCQPDRRVSSLGTPFGAYVWGGQSCGAEPLTCEVCANFGEFQNWIELLDTQLVSKNRRSGVGKPHTFGIRSDVSKVTVHTPLRDRKNPQNLSWAQQISHRKKQTFITRFLSWWQRREKNFVPCETLLKILRCWVFKKEKIRGKIG